MPAGIQTNNGKAFEYACLNSLYNAFRLEQVVEVCDTPQLKTARQFYNALSSDFKKDLNSAANAAVRVIVKLEPLLQFPNKSGKLTLTLQTDAQGIKGDVRDVLCIRSDCGWNIGLSCKHNHHAVKHSRLSDTINFGQDWFGIPCSKEYFSKVVPLFTQLRVLRDNSKEEGSPALWSDIPDKSAMYYIPILQAFMDELKKIDAEHPGEIPRALINYLIGRNDFYKVITDDAKRTTRVEAINIAGTLNRPAGKHHSIVDVPRLKLPTRFYHIGFKPDSDNTIEIVCDEGWAVSMRIHNASSKIEPSLKFDVNLISVPSSIHAQVEPWAVEYSYSSQTAIKKVAEESSKYGPD